jgi:hypothetical protein
MLTAAIALAAAFLFSLLAFWICLACKLISWAICSCSPGSVVNRTNL